MSNFKHFLRHLCSTSRSTILELSTTIISLHTESMSALFFEGDIPDYLHASPHYQQIVSDEPFPECGLEFPIGCVKKDMRVDSLADAIELLQTLRYWLLPELLENATDLIKFYFENKDSFEVKDSFSQFQNDFPFLEDLLFVAKVCPAHQVFTAVKRNRINIVKYLHEVAHLPVDEEEMAGRFAASAGYVRCLEYMHSSGLPLTSSLVPSAIVNSKKNVLHYLLNRGAEMRAGYIILCARFGKLDCLKLLVEKNCPIDEFNTLTDAFHAASQNDNVDCLEYLWQKYHPREGHRFEGIILDAAAKNGRLNVFKFAVEKNFPVAYFQHPLKRLAFYAWTECIEYLKSVGIADKAP